MNQIVYQSIFFYFTYLAIVEVVHRSMSLFILNSLNFAAMSRDFFFNPPWLLGGARRRSRPEVPLWTTIGRQWAQDLHTSR